MTVLMHLDVPEVPEAPVVKGPRAEVDRVDALNCEAGGLHDVGGRVVCEDHHYEVLRAYWAADANLILHHYDEERGICGDMVLGRWS
jgi:hypothetical protein